MIAILKEFIDKSPNRLISYADFIEYALYHPQQGYYMKDELKIGRSGDFITTSNISSIFGKIIAKWYASHYQKLHLPARFCEFGGGNGRFAKAFIEAWRQYANEPIEYIIIDSSPFHQKLQRECLQEFREEVSQLKNVEELDHFEGLVFSNELFDALPVHVIKNEDGILFEVMITNKEDKLVEVLTPLENSNILAYIQRHSLKLKNGYRIEIPLVMGEMVQRLSQAVTTGLVMTVDYGYTDEEWQQPERRDGSLRGYYQHQMYSDVLQNPGLMDITSHVPWSLFIREGEESGFELINKYRQDEFLLKLGILDELAESFDPNPFSEKSKHNRAIKSLILPGGISSSFQILFQGKGLKFAESELF